MKKMILCVFAGLFSGTAALAQIVSVNFDNDSLGVYSNAMAKADFVPLSGASSWYAMEQNGGENAKIVHDSLTQSHVLQLMYPAGCLGPNDDPLACAGQIKEPLPETADTMWVSYDVMFESGFEFVKGGKLPGLCGGKCYTGGNPPTTGDGWSARVMWRLDGAVVQYLYFVEQAGTYGDDAKWDLGGTQTQKQFVPGQWHHLVTQVTLNSVTTEGAGDRNGRIRSWFDGSLALNLDTLRLRDYADQTIDIFYLSTFHGGSDSTWSPSVDSYARFDNFVVSKDSIPVAGASAALPAALKRRADALQRLMPVVDGYLHFSVPLDRDRLVLLYATDGSLRKKSIVPAGSRNFRFHGIGGFLFARFI